MESWEKLRVGGNLVASIFIPVVVLLATNNYSAVQKEMDLNARYIELAIGILKENPTKDNTQIRKWSIDIINLYSDVKLSETAKQVLIENKILTVPSNSVDFQEKTGLRPDGFVGPLTLRKLNDEVLQLFANDKNEQAVKTVRAVLGLSLEKAKEYVEDVSHGKIPFYISDLDKYGFEQNKTGR